MTTRYFAATEADTGITRFRASKTKIYHSIKHGSYGWGFSSAPAVAGRAGEWSATEITKAEFDALNERKAARLRAAGRTLTSPSDSYVRPED